MTTARLAATAAIARLTRGAEVVRVIPGAPVGRPDDVVDLVAVDPAPRAADLTDKPVTDQHRRADTAPCGRVVMHLAQSVHIFALLTGTRKIRRVKISGERGFWLRPCQRNGFAKIFTIRRRRRR